MRTRRAAAKQDAQGECAGAHGKSDLPIFGIAAVMLADVQRLLFLGQARGHLPAIAFICSRPCINPAIASGVRIHRLGIAAHRGVKPPGARLEQFLQAVGTGLLARDRRR